MDAPSLIFVLLRRMRAPLIVLIVVYAVSVLGMVLIPGVDDKGQPWSMSFFHALYVVTYTATTIGFGELPYLFTDAQRIWMTIVVYLTVIAWLYSIGALFSIFQDSAFRALLTEHRFRRAVGRIREPFFLVCGYGDTGSNLVHLLDEAAFRSVVVDVDVDRINALEIEDLQSMVPGLRADASKPAVLELAGLRSQYCKGVVALTNDERVNLHIALATKLLHPNIYTVARADGRYAAESLRSLGVHCVVNPFDTFASILQSALHAPAMYSLYERLTSDPEDALPAKVEPPRGRWIVIGYGRFGRAVKEALVGEGMDVRIIEQRAGILDDDPSSFVGIGAEADTLIAAGVMDAVGLVAATDRDVQNLASVVSARNLNPKLFVIARQNQLDNDAMYQAARLDMVMKHGELVAHEIRSRLMTPLVNEVLRLAENQDSAWVAQLVARLDEISNGRIPARWTVDVRSLDSPALSRAISAGYSVTIGDLRRDTDDRERTARCIAMLLRRGDEMTLLPGDEIALRKGDSILLYGDRLAERNSLWLTSNLKILGYVLTGVDSRGDWLERRPVTAGAG